MNMKKLPQIILLIILFLIGIQLSAEAGNAIKPGEITPKVLCGHNPLESYSLYLPSSYKPDSKWPLLMAFEPAARAQIPPSIFKDAAEKYGYIVVCPTNSKNGPRNIAAKAAEAVWIDVNKRFPIDKQRVYATGFSGGARMSTFMHLVIRNPIRGIIAVGAGMSTAVKPDQIKDTRYLGICGYADFNYAEMVQLEQTLKAQGNVTRFMFYNARHRWPPKEMCTRAVEWLELMAIKDGLIPKDSRKDFIESTYENEFKLVKEREAAGEIYYAANDCDDLLDTFNGLRPVDELKQYADRLKKTKECKTFGKADEKRIKDETHYIRTFAGIFQYLQKTGPDAVNLTKIKASMDLRKLNKMAGNKSKDLYDASMAERLLYNLTNKANTEGARYSGSGDFKRALIFYQIGVDAGQYSFFYPWLNYRLASVHAAMGKKKKAISALNDAVKHGFKNLKVLDGDKNLDSIRETADYKEILKQLGR